MQIGLREITRPTGDENYGLVRSLSKMSHGKLKRKQQILHSLII